jgi:hypothetical protein
MTKHQRGLKRLLNTIAEQTNTKLIQLRKTNGGHLQARFDRGGPLFMASTPSDVRAIKNTAAMARRVLRRMTAA